MNDVLLGAPAIGMAMDFATVHRVLERYAFGPSLEGASRDGGGQLQTAGDPMGQINLERLK